MQTQKTLSLELGLKALSICPEKDSTHNNYCFLTSDMLSPPNTCFLGDHIGMESCLDIKNNEENIVHTSNNDVFSQIRIKRDQQLAMKKKEFPPLIPMLARTENLHSHMPWVLRRHYTSDGRLILTEERVRHHEYFRVDRSNGRLTLKLVPLDDDGLVPPFSDEEDSESDSENYCNANEEGYIETEDDGDNGDRVNDVDNDSDINVEEEIVYKDDEEGLEESSVVKYESLIPESLSIENGKSGISNSGNGGGPTKCLNYNSVRTSSSCFLGVAVPAMRPVHT